MIETPFKKLKLIAELVPSIMKLYESQHGIVYRVACECTDPDHDTIIDIDYDNEIGVVSVEFYKNFEWSSYWRSNHWWEEKWRRIKAVVKLLFTGRIQLEDSVIFTESTHLETFLLAILAGIRRMEESHARISTKME
jgi:hypothetical protein